MKYEIKPINLILGDNIETGTILDTATYLKVWVIKYEVGDEQALFGFTLTNNAGEELNTVKEGFSAQMLGNGYSDDAIIAAACATLKCELK